MELTPEVKALIDNSNYKELLTRWRFVTVGDAIFEGDSGKYYAQVMFKKRDELGPAGAAQVSKQVGWEKK
jgi:hypothetical protein